MHFFTEKFCKSGPIRDKSIPFFLQKAKEEPVQFTYIW